MTVLLIKPVHVVQRHSVFLLSLGRAWVCAGLFIMGPLIAQASPDADQETIATSPLEDDLENDGNSTSEAGNTEETPINNGCRKNPSSDVWVDKFRAGTHTRLCNTAWWLDGLFGDEERFRGEEFRGKVSIGFKHDEIEGIDPRLRVRVRTKLPNVSRRLNAFVGRVEEDSYVSNTEINQDRLNNVGLRSTNDDDSEW